MSLLTKEQQETLEIVRKSHRVRFDYFKEHATVADEMCADLLDIIDDLQGHAPQPLATEQADKATKDDAIRLLSTRQYTEQELREWFENRPLVQDEIDALLHEVMPGENEAWYTVLKFAAHVGALKAEP